MPPVGKLEASGSPRISSLPENSAIAVPSPAGPKKESCFSAVEPVRGWNQCVKWLAPRSSAHSRIAEATVSASAGSSGSPEATAAVRRSYTERGRSWRWTAGLKTLRPKIWLVGTVRSSAGIVVPLGLHRAAAVFRRLKVSGMGSYVSCLSRRSGNAPVRAGSNRPPRAVKRRLCPYGPAEALSRRRTA
jgi:hypothetical protein